jgi:hypothetical protein
LKWRGHSVYICIRGRSLTRFNETKTRTTKHVRQAKDPKNAYAENLPRLGPPRVSALEYVRE